MPVVDPNAANTLIAQSTPEAAIGFRPLSQPSILLQNGIPFVMPASGTISAAGALSGMGVALPTTYANAYFFFPANALSASSAAGWYFTRMTSTTAGIVFLNTYTSGTPSIPSTASLVSVTAGAGAYTQTSSTTTAISITLPANSMGPNGKLRFTLQQSNNNSAGTKLCNFTFGGTLFWQFALTTNLGQFVLREVVNSGVVTSQSTNAQAQQGPGSSAAAPLYLAIDTSVAQTILMRMALNTPATDAVTAEYFGVEVLPQ
jgi:hypothetical protein